MPLGLPRAEPRDCARPEGEAHKTASGAGAGGGRGGRARGLPSPHLCCVFGCARGNTQRPGTSGPFPRLPVRRGCPAQRTLPTLRTSSGRGRVSHLATLSVVAVEVPRARRERSAERSRGKRRVRGGVERQRENKNQTRENVPRHRASATGRSGAEATLRASAGAKNPKGRKNHGAVARRT